MISIRHEHLIHHQTDTDMTYLVVNEEHNLMMQPDLLDI